MNSKASPRRLAPTYQITDLFCELSSRGIEPGLGKLALPGGYIELGESWQTAATRELYEETGIPIDPAEIHLFDVHSATDTGVILIFGLAPPLSPDDLAPFRPTLEAAELVILLETAEMAFPLHQQVVTAYFDKSRTKLAPSGRSSQPAFS